MRIFRFRFGGLRVVLSMNIHRYFIAISIHNAVTVATSGRRFRLAACNKKTYPGFIGIATSVPQRVVERRPGNPTKKTAAAKGRSSIKPPKYGRKQG